MYLTRTPKILHPIASDFLWHIKTSEKQVFLTFDDGPTPEITDQTLGLLESYNAKATFFCLGKNAVRYPEIMEKTVLAGHTIGNHSFSHPDGWRTSNYEYIRDVLRASKAISSSLFRPPYGRISKGQAARLKTRFQLVMWGIITGDFDASRTAVQCAEVVIKNATPGSIIVFHDSEKAAERMLPALQQTLEFLSNSGYIFSSIPEPQNILVHRGATPEWQQ
ncbi:MAG: polysaccharide deacetylase family protein [Crocinitomicaceae bacterium]|nr:polysaccharide deacetylase family protein [Crocinitomicaceae bacterium]